MALRTFTDSRGTVWRVWETRPTSRTLRPELVTGWLTFEQGERATMRRRLAPIPEGWADLPEPELRRLCLEATMERPRQRLLE